MVSFFIFGSIICWLFSGCYCQLCTHDSIFLSILLGLLVQLIQRLRCCNHQNIRQLKYGLCVPTRIVTSFKGTSARTDLSKSLINEVVTLSFYFLLVQQSQARLICSSAILSNGICSIQHLRLFKVLHGTEHVGSIRYVLFEGFPCIAFCSSGLKRKYIKGFTWIMISSAI